jgi:hypothetical protein
MLEGKALGFLQTEVAMFMRGLRGLDCFSLEGMGLRRMDLMVDLCLRKFFGEITFLVRLWETIIELLLLIFLDNSLVFKEGGLIWGLK